jgi:ABC-type nitrate/sulfonate/bicarbonate transport system substrate-binding protein
MAGLSGHIGRRQFLGLTGAGIGAATVGLLAGCGGDAKSTPAGAGKSASGEPIKAAGAASGSAAVMRQALKLAGAELGFTVEIADMAQATALLSMRNNSVTCAMMSWVNFAQAKDQNAEAVAIAPAWASHASFIVPANSTIKTVAELKGKRLGSSERTTGVYSEGTAALADQGINIEKDTQLRPLGDSTVMLGLYKKGEFDAMLDSEPTISKELAAGTSREILQVGAFEAERNGGRLTPVNSWGVRKDWLAKQDAKKVQQLFKRASELAKTSKKPYELSAQASGLDEKATALFYERFSKLVVTEFTDQNLQDAQKLLDQSRTLGLLKSNFQVTDFVLRG